MLYPPGFYYVKKTKRFVILSSDKSSDRNLFDIIKPRRIEHLQKEEPFSSDPYFNTYKYTILNLQEKKGKKKKKNKNKVDSDPLAKSASVGVMPSYMSPVIPRSATTTSVAGKFNQEPHYFKKFEYSREKKGVLFFAM